MNTGGQDGIDELRWALAVRRWARKDWGTSLTETIKKPWTAPGEWRDGQNTNDSGDALCLQLDRRIPQGQSEDAKGGDRWDGGAAGTCTDVWCGLGRYCVCFVGEHELKERLVRLWVARSLRMCGLGRTLI
jgi:hypothetical protein